MCGGLLKKMGKLMLGIMSNEYERCYTDMEYRGVAAMGCCSGAVGGTSATEYLSETCIGCPYHVMINRKGD